MSKRTWGGIVGTAALVGSLAVSGTAMAASPNGNHGRAGGAGGSAPTTAGSPGGGSLSTGSGVATADSAGGVPTPAPPATADHEPSCGGAPAGYARCHAIELLDPARNWQGSHIQPTRAPSPSATTPRGYFPTDLQSAYAINVSGTPGAAPTVAIVDAYDDPNAAKDLRTYRQQFGLPPLCSYATSGQACATFKKYNQNGSQSGYPKGNGGWAQEISLDLDMVSAICPNCNIALVEANSSSYANLGTAENTAATKIAGVAAISNSYGGGEWGGETAYEAPYNHAGIAVTVSSGDSGYGIEFPAASRYVTAVGGTSLIRNASSPTGWSESAWSGAGSGCSAYIPALTWQPAVAGCTMRMVADASATADPTHGVAVYDSYSYQGMSGWLVFGGTSVASPIVASVYALGGAPSADNASALYGKAATSTNINDIVGGSNGSCTVTVLCTAVTGWDGPTGLGTPIGAGAF